MHYRKKDIDALIIKKNICFNLEIKLDSNIRKTGNLFFEDGFKRKYTNREGWLHYCEADYIAYYCDKNSKIYFVDFDKAKKYVLKHCKKVSFFDRKEGALVSAYLLSVGDAIENKVIISVNEVEHKDNDAA